jgi:hypothetical protein
MKILLATLAFALVAGTASADTVWTYQGNSVGSQNPFLLGPPNPCGCALSGSVTLDSDGQPIAWSFTDGGLTLNQGDSTFYSAGFGQIELGAFPFEWSVAVTDGIDGLFTQNYDNGFEATDGGTNGLMVQGNRGVWTDTVSTPEPSTLALVGLGLLALVSRGRKRAKVSSVWEPLA